MIYDPLRFEVAERGGFIGKGRSCVPGRSEPTHHFPAASRTQVLLPRDPSKEEEENPEKCLGL